MVTLWMAQRNISLTIDTDGKVTWEEDANVGGIGTTSNVGGTHSCNRYHYKRKARHRKICNGSEK